jgi:hypothetical protein
MTNDNFNSEDRKNKRRKNLGPKPSDKNYHDDESYGLKKNNKEFKKKRKEDLEEELWEDWDRYYNH